MSDNDTTFGWSKHENEKQGTDEHEHNESTDCQLLGSEKWEGSIQLARPVNVENGKCCGVSVCISLLFVPQALGVVSREAELMGWGLAYVCMYICTHM